METRESDRRRPRRTQRTSPVRLALRRAGGVPVAGLLLATTHDVSGGDEIRRSDAPRLVDLVRETQQSVDRLSAERDALVARSRHASRRLARRRRGPGSDHRPRRRLAAEPVWTRCGARARRHAQRCQTRRRGPLPARRLPRRPGGASAGHRGRAERVVERGRRGHPDAGSAASSGRRRPAVSATPCCSTAAPIARRM